MANKILVAIDVGMTCTGVCYAVAGQTSQLYMIQSWPGNDGTTANKVPTVVCYRHGRYVCWGFETRQQDLTDTSLDVAEWFKVFLDETSFERGERGSWPRSYDDVKRAYRDFLQQLYRKIKAELEISVIRGVPWHSVQIEFIFSVPTTWTAMSVTNTFEAIIKEAGFESGGSHHKVTIGLTEAEAAAIHTFTTEPEIYQDGQIILVVDAGGGTTDLALLQAEKASGKLHGLNELSHVQGMELGSVEIDLAFEALVLDRLQSCASIIGFSQADCERVSRKMARDGFRPYKENFGTEISDRQNQKKIQIEGVSFSVTIPEFGIRGGGLLVTNDEIRDIFDRQLNTMIQLIDNQMNQMATVAPHNQISYMVLSGGLGSSEYIRRRLVERYVTNKSTKHHYANGISILKSINPQAAPVQGLLRERLNRDEDQDDSILKQRISRFSLGILADQLYDPSRHLNASLYFDPTDGKRYARDQVTWFIRKGDVLTQKPLSHSFYRLQKKHGLRQPWETQIMISHKNGAPPQSVDKDGVFKLCRMTSDLTRVDLSQFEKHKKPWYSCDSSQQTYYTARYEIKFVPGAAARIDAELWFKNQKYNEPSSFKVDFDEGAKVSAPREVAPATPFNNHAGHDRWRGSR